MGNKIVTMVTTIIVLIVFIVLIAFISTDYQTDKAIQMVRTFEENIQYKGYITQDQYMDLLNKLPYKNARIQITHFKKDTFGMFAPGTLDMVFTNDIMGDRDTPNTLLCSTATDEENGIYKFEVGDQVQIDLVVLETTFFDAIVGTLTGKGSPSIKIMTSESGVILNKKYE